MPSKLLGCFFFFTLSLLGEFSCKPLNDNPPDWRTQNQGQGSKVKFPLLPYLHLSYASLCVPLLFAVQSTLSSSSRETALYKGVYSVCPCEEGSSGFFYATVLDPTFHLTLKIDSRNNSSTLEWMKLKDFIKYTIVRKNSIWIKSFYTSFYHKYWPKGINFVSTSISPKLNLFCLEE